MIEGNAGAYIDLRHFGSLVMESAAILPRSGWQSQG